MIDHIENIALVIGLAISLCAVFGTMFAVFYRLKRAIEIGEDNKVAIKEVTATINRDALTREQHNMLLKAHAELLNKHDEHIGRLYDLARAK